jgi:hypothetical protein
MIRYKHMSAEAAETQRLAETEGLPDFETMPSPQLEAWLVEAAVTEAHDKLELLIGSTEVLPAGSPHFDTVANKAYDRGVSPRLQLSALCAISRSNYHDPTLAWEMGLEVAASISAHNSQGRGRLIDPNPYIELARGQTNPKHLDMLQGSMNGRAPEMASPVLFAIGKARLEAGEANVNNLLRDTRIRDKDRHELLILQARTHAHAGRLLEANRINSQRLPHEIDLRVELQIAAVQREEYPSWDILEDALRDPHSIGVETRLRIVDLLLEGERADLALQLAASIPLYNGEPASGDEYKEAMLTIAKHRALQGDTMAASEIMDRAAKVINLNKAHALEQSGRHDFRSREGEAAKRRIGHSEVGLNEITIQRGQILAVTQPFAMDEARELLIPEGYDGPFGDFILAQRLVPDLAEAGRIGEAARLVANVAGNHYYNKSEWYVTLAKAARHRRQRQVLVRTATASQVAA